MADSHIVARAVERWEEEAVGLLVGDFALALHDRDRGRLLLARDYAGQRPLHFHRGAGFFAFASMPKGLHALADVPTGADPDALAEFLALTPHEGRRTFHRGIFRLLPGELCVVGAEGESFRRFWAFSRPPLKLKRSEDYSEAVREVFDLAVAARLRGASGRVAAHLSGGLDSGAVAATAARLLAPDGQVIAYTAVPRDGYDGAAGRFADEGAHAAAVAARHRNIEHVLVRSGGGSPVADLDRNVLLYDRPVVNLCNEVWNKAIAEDAHRRGLKVLLNGQMGNFSFSHSGFERLADLLARGHVLRLVREARLLRRRGFSLQSIVASAVGPFVPAPLWRAVRRWNGRTVDPTEFSLLRAEHAREFARRAAGAGADGRPVRDARGLRLLALGSVEPGDFYKGMLAGWALDVRDPTADRRLVELCLSIPGSEYLAGGYPRALARRAFADRLPPIVTEEIRKGYQAADWHEGLFADIESVRDEAERVSAIPEIAAILDTGRLAAMLDNPPQDGWNAGAAAAMYRLALLRGLSAAHFVRMANGN